jgi:ComF family protein
MCSICGLPFIGRQGQDHICGECIRSPGVFAKARAALVYNQTLKRLVHCFKYQGKIQLAAALGEILLVAFERHWEQERIDLVVPVPLHPKRMRKRGFNQAYLLVHRWGLPMARSLAARPGPVLQRDLIIRTRYTVPQTTLGRRKRAENIKNAFALTDCGRIKNKAILLVDDVYTTGATAGECARLLLDGGARQVDILTLARAVLPA